MSKTIDDLIIGEESPDIFNAVIEVPKGSHNKYEYDEKQGVFKLDRVMYSPFHYPLDYGFIPQTRSEDGDHLDVMVLGSDPLFTGCVLSVRPIGILYMIDGGEEDYKILGVQKDNPRYSDVKDISDIKKHNAHLLKEVSHFFKSYKDLEEKEVEIKGWGDSKAAKEEIKKAQETFIRRVV